MIKINDVYKLIKDDKSLRVIFVDIKSNILYGISLLENKWPIGFSMDEFDEMIRAGSIVLIEDTFLIKRSIDELSDIEKEKMEKAWEMISFIFNKASSKEEIYISRTRMMLLKATMDRYEVSLNTLKRYLLNYWKYSGVKTAIAGRFYLCGAKGKDRAVGAKKRGRPGIKEGINIDEAIKEKFLQGLNKYFYNNKGNNLKITYELTLRDYFRESRDIPTYHQFYYWYTKLNDVKKEVITRKGSRIYQQNYRPITGSSSMDAELGPASLWQIDSTIGDIYLVSSLDRNLIVGRPVIYIVIDVFSRAIVGVNVTIESFNSYTGAMVALVNAMTSKADYCKSLDVDIDEDMWSMACVPQRILADRGELLGAQIENAIANLGITIQNTPPYHADYKGIVEQSFRQLNLKFKPFTDGVVKSWHNKVERGEEDYRLKANLTLKEFTKIIVKSILFYNNHHVIEGHIADELMVTDGVPKIPKDIWNYGVKYRKGYLRTLDDNVIKVNLLPRKIANVTPKGIILGKLIYWSKFLSDDNWLEIARLKGNWNINVSYDPRNMGSIYYLEGNGMNFERFEIVDYLKKYDGLSEEEIVLINQKEKEINQRAKEMELSKKFQLFDDIEAIVDGGREEQKRTKISKSKKERLNGITENIQRERQLERDKVSFVEPNKIDNEISIFEKFQDEMWKNMRGD